jgi:hypothetical protein
MNETECKTATWDIVNKAKEIIKENIKPTIKVIETNILLNPNYDNDIMLDHQSRMIEVESWDDFVNEIKEAKTVMRQSCIGYMGATIPKEAKVSNLVYDDTHLSCYVVSKLGNKSKKLAFKIN